MGRGIDEDSNFGRWIGAVMQEPHTVKYSEKKMFLEGQTNGWTDEPKARETN